MHIVSHAQTIVWSGIIKHVCLRLYLFSEDRQVKSGEQTSFWYPNYSTFCLFWRSTLIKTSGVFKSIPFCCQKHMMLHQYWETDFKLSKSQDFITDGWVCQENNTSEFLHWYSPCCCCRMTAVLICSRCVLYLALLSLFYGWSLHCMNIMEEYWFVGTGRRVRSRCMLQWSSPALPLLPSTV